jgi:hypothetical protein
VASQLVRIYWRDIPSQVNAQRGRTRAQRQLGERFQVGIDRAAMIAGLAGSDEYLNEWRRVSEDCDDDLEAVAEAAARDLDTAYPPERLRAIIDNGGIDPDAPR